MRVSTALILAAPALTLAEEAQIPILDKVKGFFNKATAAAVSSISASISAPADAAATEAVAKVAEFTQHTLTLDNWKDVLTTDGQSVALFSTGGNNTCFGLCTNATLAWNESLPYIAAIPNAPKLVYLDCEAETPLCNSLSLHAPSLYVFEPQSNGEPPVARYTSLNRTTTDTEKIKKLIIGNEIAEIEPYWGPFHPFNGTMFEYGLAMPYGQVTYWFSKMPSWLPMVLISFVSRSFMSKRMAGPTPAEARAANAQRAQ